MSIKLVAIGAILVTAFAASNALASCTVEVGYGSGTVVSYETTQAIKRTYDRQGNVVSYTIMNWRPTKYVVTINVGSTEFINMKGNSCRFHWGDKPPKSGGTVVFPDSVVIGGGS